MACVTQWLTFFAIKSAMGAEESGESELRCLQILHRFSHVSQIRPTMEELDRCQQSFGTAALRVDLPRKEAYLQRVADELQARGQRLRGNVSARLVLCVPYVCMSHPSLVRLVVHYSLLVHALQVAPPLPRALQPSEVRWRILRSYGVPAGELKVSPPGHFGRCLCSQDLKDLQPRIKGSLRGPFTVREVRSLTQDLQRPGPLRRAALEQIGQNNRRKRMLPFQLSANFPDWCFNPGYTDAGSCSASLLSTALLLAAGAKTPADLVVRLDDAVASAAVMRDCPWPLLDVFACDDCYAPPPGFRISALLEKTSAAHSAFARGSRRFKEPLSWRGSDELSCDVAEMDAQFEAAASSQAASFQSAPARVACLYLSALPNDLPAVRRAANTFARHCDWAKFFAAPPSDQERRSSWHFTARQRTYEIVNLAQAFPEAKTDESWMQTRWASDSFETRLWSGNTIQKSLLMAVHTARHNLQNADLFCLLELDSAFVAENLRAFARAHSLQAEEPVFIAALNLGMKKNIGIIPHTAGGACMTREALRRLSQHLELQKMDAVRYPFPNAVGFWAPDLAEGPPERALRVNGCGFVAGHWWDIMLSRCFIASNVSAHPAIEDALGRYYFGTNPLPCREHLNSWWSEQLPTRVEGRPLQRLATVMCQKYGFAPEMHRYLACEPAEVAAGADYWLSPYTIGMTGLHGSDIVQSVMAS